jgi:hypothetical protein
VTGGFSVSEFPKPIDRSQANGRDRKGVMCRRTGRRRKKKKKKKKVDDK